MQKEIFRASERGITSIDWLLSRHSFSFGEYYHPKKMGFGVLRVLNDDTIAPGQGFDMHPHANMEIVSIVLKGALKHEDSMGNHGIIKEGEIQTMSAGSGITHSEFNPSKKEAGEFLQIWIHPKEKNITPRYGQRKMEKGKNSLNVIISPEKGKNTLSIHQDAYFSIGEIEKGKEIKYSTNKKSNGVYLFAIEGKINVEGDILSRRDAIAIQDAGIIKIRALEKSELLLIEMSMM